MNNQNTLLASLQFQINQKQIELKEARKNCFEFWWILLGLIIFPPVLILFLIVNVINWANCYAIQQEINSLNIQAIKLHNSLLLQDSLNKQPGR